MYVHFIVKDGSSLKTLIYKVRVFHRLGSQISSQALPSFAPMLPLQRP